MTRHIISRAGGSALFAAVVATGASSVAEAAPRLSKALKEQADFLCERTEFSRTEIRALQTSADFPALLAYTLGVCPEIGAVLSDGATASVRLPLPPRDNDNDRDPGRGSKDKEKGGESKI